MKFPPSPISRERASELELLRLRRSSSLSLSRPLRSRLGHRPTALIRDHCAAAFDGNIRRIRSSSGSRARDDGDDLGPRARERGYKVAFSKEEKSPSSSLAERNKVHLRKYRGISAY